MSDTRERAAEMKAAEAIAAVRSGQRVKGKCSLHDSEKEACPGFNCQWRVIFCDSDEDVVECRECGRQAVTKCDFDEEYA